MTGKVLAYHRREGYAFIRPAEGRSKDVFVHIKEVRFGKLEDGVVVEYEIVERNGRPRAVNVRVMT